MNMTESIKRADSFDQDEDTIQSRANLFATRLRKLAANIEDEAAQDVGTIEGATILENVLGVEALVDEFVEWYHNDNA